MADNRIIHLQNQVAECKISLWGGNLLSYRKKKKKKDVFWLGDLNKFDNVQAIRGGIPICWPRFAEEELNNHLPRHGFARLSMWHLQNVNVDEDYENAREEDKRKLLRIYGEIPLFPKKDVSFITRLSILAR